MAARDLTSQNSIPLFASTAQHNHRSVVKCRGTQERSSTNPASVDGLIPTRLSHFLTARPNTLVWRLMVKDVQMMQWRLEHTSNNGLAFYVTVLHASATFVSNFSGIEHKSFQRVFMVDRDMALYISQ
ncbi:uncharacterized protein Bfra_010274 [Botrytis fragariae]|uniref:Uncharacterized protein n=1 Tax=Botrytis fragariae TaxID=1964551 RepID=A0A8H6ALU2_9HELO|nr:uncharacterized protein Bfra_010274 [Botrytis fragariae]KAF5870128.1 hypothetical protein Bfra_010274 [Botrytis fragariae]